MQEPTSEITHIHVDRYTEIRKAALIRLLNKLLEKKVLDLDNLQRVVDLGSYQGSSSSALMEIGASTVISVDQNQNAIQIGNTTGWISGGVVSDMVLYIQQNLPANYKGLITAFNCIMYLSDEDIWALIHKIEEKLAPGSQFVFTFSKTKLEWQNLLSKYFENENGRLSGSNFVGLTSGELDYNCFVVTAKLTSELKS